MAWPWRRRGRATVTCGALARRRRRGLGCVGAPPWNPCPRGARGGGLRIGGGRRGAVCAGHALRHLDQGLQQGAHGVVRHQLGVGQHLPCNRAFLGRLKPPGDGRPLIRVSVGTDHGVRHHAMCDRTHEYIEGHLSEWPSPLQPLLGHRGQLWRVADLPEELLLIPGRHIQQLALGLRLSAALIGLVCQGVWRVGEVVVLEALVAQATDGAPEAEEPFRWRRRRRGATHADRVARRGRIGVQKVVVAVLREAAARVAAQGDVEVVGVVSLTWK
mmetsp:Transcript_75987/g.220699  ORF Transcript_75987/g.220699 Transcript_75987/m.220699 type:complete len:273 (+) Transcript_75987:680-1498(+)